MSNGGYINTIKTGMEKKATYQELNKRRNISEKNCNYVEMISYDYAMIEDRLLSILKHLNVVKINNNNEVIINKDIKNEFYDIYYNNPDKSHKDPQIYNLSTKIKIIKIFLKYNDNNNIILNISNILKSSNDEVDIETCLKKIEKWSIKRNEVVHGMYNKNIEDFDLKIKDIAIDGKKISYDLSKMCDIVKKKIKDNK